MNHKKNLTLNKETLKVLTNVQGVEGGYTTLLNTEAYCNGSGAYACLPVATYGCPATVGQESVDGCGTGRHC